MPTQHACLFVAPVILVTLHARFAYHGGRQGRHKTKVTLPATSALGGVTGSTEVGTQHGACRCNLNHALLARIASLPHLMSVPSTEMISYN